MKIIRPLLLLILLAQLLPSPAAAAGGGTRLYLLATSAGDGYWSVDPADPELPALTTHRTCGGVTLALADGACTSPLPIGTSTFEHLIPFSPATLIDDPGDAHTQPLKFHLRLDVGSPAPYTVHVALDRSNNRVVSAPATQVAPGVWEGTLQESQPLGGLYNTLNVLIRSDAPMITVTTHTAGQSWIELGHTIAARGIPELKRADPAQVTSSYTGAGRTLRFTDENWSATSFPGDLTKTRTFQYDLVRPATMVIAWVETFDSPLVYDVVNQRTPDPRRLESSPHLTMTHDGGQVAGKNTGIRGRGQDSVAALDVAGRVDLEVSAASWDPDRGGQNHPYELHVVAVHGPRTLRSMRWRFATGYNLRTPAAAACPYGYEPVPVPSNVTTFSADVDWRTFAQPAPSWTVSFDLPSVGFVPCGERTQDDRVSFTMPPLHRVWMLGPAPSQRALYASTDDTVFQMQVDYTYGP
jgi:hypothetical protein